MQIKHTGPDTPPLTVAPGLFARQNAADQLFIESSPVAHRSGQMNHFATLSAAEPICRFIIVRINQIPGCIDGNMFPGKQGIAVRIPAVCPDGHDRRIRPDHLGTDGKRIELCSRTIDRRRHNIADTA